MGKIKIKESQLKKLMEQNISNDFHMDKTGEMQQGEINTSDPYELAERIVGDMDIPSEYTEDNERFLRLIDAIHEVMSHKIETGESTQFGDQKNSLEFSDTQLNEKEDETINESVNELKNTFKRFM